LKTEELLLINPPLLFRKGFRRPSISIPLGLLYVIANIRNKAKASLMDFLGHPDVRLDNFQKPKNDVCEQDYWIGLSIEQIKEQLARMKIPRFVGINLSFISHSLVPVVEIARIIKQIDPQTVIIVGGSGVIEGLLDRFKDIDIVYFGEGEDRLINILRGEDLSKLRGIEFRSNRVIINTGKQDFIDNLDNLRPPVYTDIELEKYFYFNSLGAESRYSYNTRSISFVTSRGCPFNCNFCMIGYVMGRRCRMHSVGYISQQLNLLKNKFSIEHLHIEDDNLSLDINRFILLLNEFKRAGISWDPSNGIMVNQFDQDIVHKIKASGCRSLRVAPESGSQRVIDNIIGKKVSLKHIKNVIKWSHEAGLDVIGYLVIGFPEETMDDLQQTLDFAQEYKDKYKVRWSVCMANPIWGSRLRQYCIENNLLVNDDVIEVMGQGYKSRYMIKHPEFNEEFLSNCIRKIQSSYL